MGREVGANRSARIVYRGTAPVTRLESIILDFLFLSKEDCCKFLIYVFFHVIPIINLWTNSNALWNLYIWGNQCEKDMKSWNVFIALCINGKLLCVILFIFITRWNKCNILLKILFFIICTILNFGDTEFQVLTSCNL